MKKKFTKFLDNLSKYTYRYIFIVFVCTIIFLSFKHYDLFFVYPEQEYQFLETEINRIISTNDFNTEYDLNINYNTKNDYLEIQIYRNDINVTAKITNYNEENQEVILQRDCNSIGELIVLLPLFALLITGGIFIALFLILILLAGLIDFITKLKK